MLFNLSIKNCELPYDWKLAHVTPIPKSNDKSDPLNYRPISLLSILVKLLEKHMYSKILEHLKDISFLSNKQWGFTKGKSTTGALLTAVHTPICDLMRLVLPPLLLHIVQFRLLHTA